MIGIGSVRQHCVQMHRYAWLFCEESESVSSIHSNWLSNFYLQYLYVVMLLALACCASSNNLIIQAYHIVVTLQREMKQSTI